MNAFPDATRARRYLLGETSDEENATIEAQYLEDENALAHLTSIEDELIETYLEGRLPAAEHAAFERAYLASPRRRARVEAIRQLRRAAAAVASERPATVDDGSSAEAPSAAKVVRIDTHRNYRRLWRPWLALAASLLIVGAAIGVTRRAAAPQPGAQAAQTLPPASQESPVTTSTPAQAAPQLFTIALTAALVRGAGDSSPVRIPEGTERIRLQLALESQPRAFTSLRVAIAGVGGQERWRGPATASASTAEADVPAAALPPDDYIVTLSGLEAGSTRELEWAQYALRVR